MATIKSPGTWVDLNGQITCLTHAPMSLTARLEERPRLRTVTTTTTHETPRHAHHRHHCAPEVSDHTPTAADPATADVLDQASPVRHA